MKRTKQGVLVVVCLLISFYSYGGSQATVDPDIHAFVDAAIVRIGSSALSMSHLVGTELETVVDLPRADNHERCLCWLQSIVNGAAIF